MALAERTIVVLRFPVNNNWLCPECGGRDCACADYNRLAQSVAQFVDSADQRACRDARKAASRARGKAAIVEMRAMLQKKIDAERDGRAERRS